MGIVSKCESKQSKSFAFITYSVFKDFDQKIFILLATLHLKMAINFERNHLKAWNFEKSAIYVYIKIQNVLSECIFTVLKKI